MAVTPGAIVTEHVEHHHNHAREKRPMPDQLEYAAQQPIIVMEGAQRRRVRSDLGFHYFTRPFNKASKRGQYRDGAAGRKFRHFTSVGGLLPKYKRRRASIESVAVRRGVTMAVLKAEQAKLVDFWESRKWGEGTKQGTVRAQTTTDRNGTDPMSTAYHSEKRFSRVENCLTSDSDTDSGDDGDGDDGGGGGGSEELPPPPHGARPRWSRTTTTTTTTTSARSWHVRNACLVVWRCVHSPPLRLFLSFVCVCLCVCSKLCQFTL
jgi:hypothetical protein